MLSLASTRLVSPTEIVGLSFMPLCPVDNTVSPQLLDLKKQPPPCS